MTQGFIPVSNPKEESGSKSKKEHFLATEFRKHFASVKDPRIERTKAHNLLDIIAIALLAVLSGADGWEEIEAQVEGKLEWLKQFLELPNGIPSHDTFSRVFARINPKKFQESFGSSELTGEDVEGKIPERLTGQRIELFKRSFLSNFATI